MEPAKLSFASWVRRGLAAAIERPDENSAGAQQTKVRVSLEFNSNREKFRSETDLTLVGPGDIVGFDPRAIVRVFPRPDDNDAESGFFALVELDQPDLPWRYTPARAKGNRAESKDTLRPWLNLVVLVEGAEVDLARDLAPASAARKLPVLTTKGADLPDLTESWAWAHAQANGPKADTADDLKQPGTVGRVISPRRLKKNTAYVAFLVPTFKRGARVGTVATPKEWEEERRTLDALDLAWKTTDAKVELPVYYHWRFQTGSVGSFTEVALALEATSALGETVGARPLDIRKPGLELPPALEPPPGPPAGQEPPHMLLGGALQSLAARGKTDPTLSTTWVTKLKQFVDAPSLLVGGVQTKVVAPPLYGRWHASQKTLDAPAPPPLPNNPTWFFALNTDPRLRVAAALGTEVVQRDQEALMASAWAQVESLERINQERRVMQTGVHAFESLLGRHVKIGSFESLFASTSLLHGRIKVGTGTAFSAFGASPLRIGFLTPTWRRMASPFGTIGRRLGLTSIATGQSTNLFQRVNSGVFEPGPSMPTLPGTRLPADAFGTGVPGGLSTAAVGALVDRLGASQLTFFGLLLFWVARQLLLSEKGRFWWLLQPLLRLGLDLIRLAGDPQKQRQAIWEKLRDGTLTVGDVDKMPKNGGFKTLDTLPDLANPSTLPPPPVPPPASEQDSGDAVLFRQALRDLITFVTRDLNPRPVETPVNLGTLKTQLLGALDPRPNFVAEANLRHIRDESVFFTPQDLLEPLMAAPNFPQPMSEPLAEISPEWLVPNLGEVPRNTVSALVVNQRFIEAYMVGLSHEMGRELLWNRYPTDQRGTYFRQFWDPRGFVAADPMVPAKPPEASLDIKEIHTWAKRADLGGNSPRDPLDPAVVLVRGDVIKRYPNVMVYAAKAPAADQERVPDDSRQSHPVFQGRLGGDAAYYGFNRTLAELRSEGGSGWYVVLQERPSEPRFTIPSPDATEANVKVSEINGATSAGTLAQLQFQKPTRVAIHAADLIPA